MATPEDIPDQELTEVWQALARTDRELYQLVRVIFISVFSEYVAEAVMDYQQLVKKLDEQLDRLAVQITITQGEAGKTQAALSNFLEKLKTALEKTNQDQKSN